MLFWLTAVAMASGVAGLLARAMLRGQAIGTGASDLDIYRDQLAEVERDRDRGLISATEADRLKVEVSRRLLDADRKTQATADPGAAPKVATGAVAILSALAVIGGGLGLYWVLGAPGYSDLPIQRRIQLADEARKDRPDQAMAEAEAALSQPSVTTDPRHAELMEELRATLNERPDDLEGYLLLARNEAGIGNFAAARRAQERVLDLKGTDATSADWADYALLLVYAAGGYVSPEAEAAIAEVLERDPQNGTARYLMGLLYAQTDRPDLAFRIWRTLLEESPQGAPWSAPIRAEIEDLANRAGVDYRAPQMRGPTGADMAAASDMTAEERQQMIRGMVEGLAGRLAEDGGPAEDWAQLITALGVLGETERATAIYSEAREAFDAHAEDLALIEAAAERAGIAE